MKSNHLTEVVAYNEETLGVYRRFSLAGTEVAVNTEKAYSFAGDVFTYEAAGATVFAATEVAVGTAVADDVFKTVVDGSDNITKLAARDTVGTFFQTVAYLGKVSELDADENYVYTNIDDAAKLTDGALALCVRYSADGLVAKDEEGDEVELGTVTLKGLGKDNEIAEVTVVDEASPAGTSIFNRDMYILASKGGTVLGTDAADNIMVSGSKATITAGEGDDEIISLTKDNTFNMSGRYRDDEIMVATDSKNSFVFSDVYVDEMVFGRDESGTLAVASDLGSIAVDNLNLDYASLTDASKAKYTIDTVTVDTDLKGAKSNSVVFAEVADTATKGLTIKDSAKNDAVIGSDKADTFYYMQGGRDLFQGNEGKDLYNVEKMDAKTALTISDSSNGNILSFTDSDVENEVGLFFDVNANNTLNDGSNVWFYDRASVTAKTIAAGLNSGSIAGAVRVSNIDLASSDFATDFGKVYDESVGNGGVDVDGWIGEVKGNVVAWLGVHTNFDSAMEVFANGTQADINSLMNAYNSADAGYNPPPAP